ncbi:uncharacterized protein LOC112502509 isoform X2 [Cynara cardunculus var. scolymus]|uniref:uncharacterized protein LOC112502509 isoform X2 n=1 Tax=Cynara cardunculus var. scolymus TaxID=59895 RepID=UPI000D624FB1|nr:uncharacterized protein LOC112502509 isoform X2 [Cynara cardunculus var. scolymus]
MEFPSFHHHHHHNRYVPPPPPKNFSDDSPSLYPHHNHLLPPPRLPPPPPLSYHSLPPPPPPPPPVPVPPPPPSYNPHQSHFTFLDAQNPSYLNHPRSSPPPPRFSNHPHRFDYRTDSWSDPHRILPERPHRNPILPVDRHHRLYSPNSPSENYYKPHVLERVIPSSRYRDDTIVDGYASRDINNIVTQEQQVFRGGPNSDDHHGRNTVRYASARSVMDMDKATGSSLRNSEDFVETYEPCYMTVLESERTWDGHGDEDPRWVHAMKGKKNEFGHGGNEGVSFVSAREQSRDYEYESSKFNRVREGREEFKQVQKKSVLLRIGKPNNTYRNRSHDQHFSKAYLVESGSSNFRGKDKDRDHTGKDSSLYLDQRVEGGRERSPVELDVSFKPNGLVAKAVVTPSSPVFENNYSQPRNRKIKRATEFDSPLTKFGERSTRSGSSSYGLECPLSSEKAPKQLRDKDSAYNAVRVGDFSSLPCSDAVDDSSRNGADGSFSGPVLDQAGGSGGSDGPLSFRLRKKRKRMNLGSHAFNFQLGEKEDNSVKGGDFKNSPSAHIRGVVPFPPLDELIASKVDESPQAMVSEKDSEVENLSSLSDPSNPNLHDTKSCGDDPTENNTLTKRKVSTINDGLVKDLSQQPSQNEVPLEPENDAQKVSTDVMVPLDGTDISASLGHDQIEIQKWPTESYASFDDANISYSLCNVSVKMPEMSASADMNLLDPCSGKIITVLSENGAGQGFDDVSRKDEEFPLLEGTPKTDGCNPSSGATSILNVSFQKNVKDIIPERCIAGDASKQTCFNETRDGAILCSGESHIYVAKKNMKDLEIQFNLPTPGEKHEDVVAAVLNAGAAPSITHEEISSDKDGVSEMVTLISSPVQTLRPDNWEPSTDRTYLIPKDDLQPSSSILSACVDGTGAIVTDSNDKSGESMPDMLTSTVTSQKVSSSSGFRSLIRKSTNQAMSNLSFPKDDGNICEKSVSKDGSLLNRPESLIENSRTNIKSNHLEVTGFLANTKTASSTYQGSSVKTSSFNMKMQGSNLPMKKLSSISAVPRVFAGHSSPVLTNSRINNPAKNIAKPRTWHRSTSNFASSSTKSSSICVPPPPKQIGMGQNSYIRSGNTLVRKGAPVTAISSVPRASRSSLYQLNPSGPIETRNSAGSGSKVRSTNSTLGGSSTPVVRPKTPPLSGGTKLPDCTTIHSRDLPTLPLEHQLMKGNCEEAASPVEGNFAVQKVSQYHKSSRASEDQNGTSSNSESQKTLDEGTAPKKIQYVKRKSNQLVATSNSDQSIQDLDKTQASSSDGYYKRRKNQLIRTWVEDDLVNTDVQKVSKTNVKRQSGKGISKKYKHLRYPSVWTLGSQSLGKDGVSLRQKLRPHLFPWKRSRYLGNVMNTSASIPSNSSSSSISKLLLSRKRETIYTRSKHGFSLRMSKLLSVGGSSLKWSKSIERNSKRANEEATLAVAAAEKKRREQHGTACTTAETKSRNNMSRDRIFRIGLVRYRMDPSRRTLQRISDEKPSTSMQSKEEIRRSYVPKRLLIGHDEYVRIGNGNQLVRNPKRRTRIFANEKVRWSLHTARSRLAKKKKYCQFFTRFGKCNKDDGKCQYIHDSSKISVCTKFLNGSCSNPDCKLTHKVIPERMQDCSYFLQGLCSNEHCPYRHVNVNSAASICEGFLKGYCADGNECRKKHTYACPVFEATGACSQGTKCKLHHPRNRNIGGLKRKQHSMEQHQQQKNSRGRYFGSIGVGVGEAITISHLIKDDDDIININDDDDDDGDLCREGKFAEYISLGFSNEEATTLSSEPSDCGYDEITKPIRIMSKNLGEP